MSCAIRDVFYRLPRVVVVHIAIYDRKMLRMTNALSPVGVDRESSNNMPNSMTENIVLKITSTQRVKI